MLRVGEMPKRPPPQLLTASSQDPGMSSFLVPLCAEFSLLYRTSVGGIMLIIALFDYQVESYLKSVSTSVQKSFKKNNSFSQWTKIQHPFHQFYL